MIKIREADQVEVQAMSIAADDLVGPPAYQIGATVAALAGLAVSDDPWPIRIQTWTLAFNTVLQNKGSLGADTVEILEKALNNMHQLQAPASKGFFGFGRSKKP